MTRKQKWILGCAVAILLSAPLWLSYFGFFVWSRLNCWHHEVDIHSGRIRYTRYFLYAQVVQRVDESALSSALDPSDLSGVQPDWQRVHTFSPGVGHSPHYAFHSAMGQIRDLELYWRVGEFTPAAQRASAKRVLELWQQSQNDDTARAYLVALSGLTDRMDSEHHRIDASDLPP